MKLSDLFENDDDSLRKFHKSLGDEIRAKTLSNKAMHDAMFKNHKWLYDIGDVILSKKTGMAYTITGHSSQMWAPTFDENGNFYKKGERPEKKLVPTYRYKAGDEEGTLIEPLFKPGMYTLITKGKNVRTTPDED